jgi:hypothetical protein
VSWAIVVLDSPDGGVEAVHVMPADETGEPLVTHVAEYGCWCRPRRVADIRLNPPILSHRAPAWPGAIDKLD